MEKLIKKHLVHSYECDKDGKLRVLTLFNLLQNMADAHAEMLNVGYQHFVEKKIGWVGAGYALRINNRPKWGDEITFSTWPSGLTPMSAIRDFKVLDSQQKTLFDASSQWVLIDMETGRPQAIKKHIQNLESLNERALETHFPTIPILAKVDFEKHFSVRYDDIDINQHVNNAIYPIWASESVPVQFRELHDITQMQISFKRPAFFGDEILISTQINDLETLHSITNMDKTTEFARVSIVWEKKS